MKNKNARRKARFLARENELWAKDLLATAEFVSREASVLSSEATAANVLLYKFNGYGKDFCAFYLCKSCEAFDYCPFPNRYTTVGNALEEIKATLQTINGTIIYHGIDKYLKYKKIEI